MRRAESTTDLSSGLRDLSRAGMEPSRDLWPGIEAAIRAHARRRSRIRRLAAAAGVVAALGATSILRVGDSEVRSLGPPSSRAVPVSSSAALAEAFADYQRSRLELRRILVRELAAYPPELARAIEADLAVIDAAIENLEAALVAAPQAEDLELDLAALYRHELRLLRDLGERLEGSDVAL